MTKASFEMLSVTNNNPAKRVIILTNGTIHKGKFEVKSPFTRVQINSLKGLGWDVLFFSVDGIANPIRFGTMFFSLRKLIKREEPVLLHATYGSAIAFLASRVKGKKNTFLVSFGGDDLLGTPNLGLIWRLRERIARLFSLSAAKVANNIIVKSDNLYEALPEKLRNKATVLPNGVDTEVFKPIELKNCREQLGWPRDQKVVLFNAGSSGNKVVKNVGLARQVISHLKRQVPEARLIEISCEPHDRVVKMMNVADALLVTSLHEGSPNIVKEAMACNLPIVSVPCGDTPKRLAYCHPGSVCLAEITPLAEALNQVLKAGKRSNGRDELFNQGIDANTIAKRLDKIYLELYEKIQ